MTIKDFEFKYEDDNGHDTRSIFLGEYISELVHAVGKFIEFSIEFNAEDFLDEDDVSFIDEIADHLSSLAYPSIRDDSEEGSNESYRVVSPIPVEISCYSNESCEDVYTIRCYVKNIDTILTDDKLLATLNIINAN